MKIQKREIFSIPNVLGYIRILLIPLFVWRYLTAQSGADYYTAAGIVLLSGLTDLFDGLIARRFHMITELGKVLDPIADKLTQAAIVFCLMFRVRWMVCSCSCSLLRNATWVLPTLLLCAGGEG